MATTELNELKSLIPYMLKHKNLWSSYNEEVDVLYLHFKKPNHADDSELTDDDTIIRYENGEVVGITILNASQK
ncbi:MAG: DUF2283 domain-containing protein [Spirosoma sp.]|nr:DUF2283 domain-containing protein [Spirosoma sp.]